MDTIDGEKLPMRDAIEKMDDTFQRVYERESGLDANAPERPMPRATAGETSTKTKRV